MKKTAVAFGCALALQMLILLLVPAQKMRTRATGRDVVLKVAPVDPYSLLSGYYVTLGYEVGNRSAFPNHAQADDYGKAVYAILERGNDGVWRPQALSKTLPKNLPEYQIALRGRNEYERIRYGIEEFYIPESQRQTIADDLQKHPDAARVEIKVDSSGNAALMRLRIEERVYQD